jgi:hypothetical protein
MDLRISETSITEELLYRFTKAFRTSAYRSVYLNRWKSIETVVMLKYSSKPIAVSLLLACQAKICYKSSKYHSFHHVGGARQIDLLRDYAKRNGGIAQYLFYNYVPDDLLTDDARKIENIEYWGITHLAADELIRWIETFEISGKKPSVPHFNDFHPMAALPFHQLICALLADDTAYKRLIPKAAITDLTLYDEAAVSNSDAWQQVTSLATSGYVDQELRSMMMIIK